MSEEPAGLSAKRDARDAARGRLETGLGQVRKDLDARSVGGRIVSRANKELRAAAAEAVEIAKDSKGVIAATAGVLTVWLLREPLLDAVRDLFSGDADASGEEGGPYSTEQDCE